MILFKRVFILFVVQFIALFYFSIKAQIIGAEVAYVQTDRTTYIAGESIFYKLYVLDAVTKKRSEVSKVGYILLRFAKTNPCIKIRVKVDSGLASGSFVLPDTLSSGVYQLVAFTSEMKNFGERQYFYNEIMIANRFDKELSLKVPNPDPIERKGTKQNVSELKINTSKTVYGSHEKVIVSLGKTNSKANVSVSVFEDSGLLSTDKTIVETLNRLLPAQPDKKIINNYLPENKGKIIRGRVVEETTQKVIKSATVLLSCMDSVPNLQYASTNSNGMFQMLLSDYYNGKQLFFTIKDMPEGQHWKIEIEDEFALSEKSNPSLVAAKDQFKQFILKSQSIVYINKSYQLNNDIVETPITEGKLICPRVYHCPVSTVLTSDFVPLNDFPEIVVELLPLVRINKKNDKYRIHTVTDSPRLSNDNPAIFLDGVFVDDINMIIGLGSEQIKKIDVAEDERAFGELIYEGIISITSKANEILNTRPASYSLRIKNDDFNKGRSFVAINPNLIDDKYIPYYKQLLYWNPDLELNGTDDTNFEFYTSDNVANFVIKVEGISENGTPVSTCSTIKVVKKLNVKER